MYNAIFFDFDGTLANDLSYFIKAYDFALKKFGIELSEEEIPTVCFHKSETDVAARLNISSEDFTKYYFQGIDKFINDIPIFDGVIPLLEELKKRKTKLGVITLAKRWYVEKMLNQTGLAEYFQSVVSCDDVKNPKPAPESIHLSCENLSVDSNDTLLVGDAKGDILMGRAVGCKTALFLPDENKPYYDFDVLKQTKPDYIFYNYKELKNIIYD